MCRMTNCSLHMHFYVILRDFITVILSIVYCVLF